MKQKSQKHYHCSYIYGGKWSQATNLCVAVCESLRLVYLKGKLEWGASIREFYLI